MLIWLGVGTLVAVILGYVVHQVFMSWLRVKLLKEPAAFEQTTIGSSALALVALARLNGPLSSQSRTVIQRQVATSFSLHQRASQELVQDASDALKQYRSPKLALREITSVLKAKLVNVERQQVITMAQRVIQADGPPSIEQEMEIDLLISILKITHPKIIDTPLRAKRS